MLRLLHLFPIALGILLISCSAPTPAKPPAIMPNVHPSHPSVSSTNQGQKLPISAIAVVPNGTNIELEVAKTPKQQEMGLMYRPALPDNQGMLFEFPSPQPTRFWMKNCIVPLDMVFIREGVVEYIAASAPPCDKEPCPTYGPNQLIDRVIELRAGRAAELGLKVGDKIAIRFLTAKGSS